MHHHFSFILYYKNIVKGEVKVLCSVLNLKCIWNCTLVWQTIYAYKVKGAKGIYIHIRTIIVIISCWPDKSFATIKYIYVEVTSKIWEARGKHWAIKAIECIAKVFHKSFCKSVVSYILRSKILDDLLKKPFYQYDIETNTSPDLKTTMQWILK